MASCSAATRALILSRKPLQPPPPPPLPSPSCHLSSRRHLIALPATTTRRRTYFSSSANGIVCCIVSDVDGGGVSDTRRSEFSRGFAVIANMLKRIEPLDTSDIAQGVSDSAKDSMKQTISTMLGLLPSDQFSVSVRVSKLPLHRLLFSAIITGYTLWNAEYRISLMRNYELSYDSSESSNCLEETEVSEVNSVDMEYGNGETCVDKSAKVLNHHALEGLSPKALSYVHQLEAELRATKKEVDEWKRDHMQMESKKKDENELLQYLRSLEFDMVTELSQPSSMEVKEVIHDLVQNILQRFFKDETTLENTRDGTVGSSKDQQDGVKECCETTTASRDYLAQLLFWCMLLGHHLRGLENRLHLTCVVGLL
ncbi:hypothetical protein Ancab_005800 [Ancistrocladus abbreviatus]